MKKSLITGITGQDGAYLAKYLLEQGYKVFGAYRRTSYVNFWRLDELGVKEHPNLELVEYDLTDMACAVRLLEKTEPDEVYNLAAMSFVGVSFDQPVTTLDITGKGALHLLEAIRIVNKNIKFYQASTSEMFGMVQEIPQKETTPFYPRSPYGISKLYAHWMTINYRESYGIFAASGILFNHESPLRGMEFISRKITASAARIMTGKQDVLELGNLNAKRDWGFAGEYVKGMHLMLKAEKPDTYVLATGVTITVREFAEKTFRQAGVELAWKGEGQNEEGVDKATGKTLVRVNRKFYRPAEVDLLIGDASKAYMELGWKAEMAVDELCAVMFDADLRRAEKGLLF